MVTVLKFFFFFFSFLFVYAYSGYALCMRLVSRVFGHKPYRDPAFCPAVTILVPAYNEESVIARKIENCLALDYPRERLEIMVCSDNSSDRTSEIVRTYTNKQISFFDYKERRGKTGVINRSLPKARGEIVVLTDANTMCKPDAVRKMVGLYADASIGAVLGQVQLIVPEESEGVGKEVEYRNFETELKYAEGLFGASIGAFGGFYSIRKSLFEPLPPNAYSNDDLLIPMFILRNGYKTVFDKEAVSVEETGKDVAEEFRRRVRIGAGNFQSFSFLRKMLNPFLGMPFVFYVSHKVLRWFSPFLLMGMFLTNLLLIRSSGRFLRWLLILQIGFYGVSFLGYSLSLFRISLPLVSSIYHFIAMNLAVFLGFFRFSRGIESATWQSTERAQT